jgi:hypothetical protein
VSYATPIGAACRHCEGEFDLTELLADNDGRCPRCETLLSPEWISVLLEEARQAELAEELLIKSLRRLVGLPGNMVLLPHTVLDNFWDGVGWEQKLAGTPELLHDEVRRATLGLDGWERLRPEGPEPAARRRLDGVVEHLRHSGRNSSDR